jgi:F-type H+-transporting ATPase subunit delta
MSSSLTLARPYARAAFELARDTGALAEWSRKLGVAAAIAGDARVRSLIGDPHLDTAQLNSLFLPEGEAQGTPFAAFVSELALHRRLPTLPDVATLFEELKREHEKVLKVTLRTAVPVEAAQGDALRAALERRFGRKVEIDTVIDADVIGGAVIDAGDVVIDGSVRGRLGRLEHAIAD